MKSKATVQIPLILMVLGIAIIANGQQYKKFHRNIMADVVDQRFEKARKDTYDLLATNPCDPESFYVLAMIHGIEGNIDSAMFYVLRALREGLPFERFLAGPRKLLAPLVESKQFNQLLEPDCSNLIHGPMIGSITDRSARFWVRTAKEMSVQIYLSEEEDMSNPITSQHITTRPDRDYTAVLSMEDLKTDQLYFYQVSVGDRKEPDFWTFRTLPKAEQPAQFEIGFGGGAGYTPQYRHMWETIASHHLPAFILLGDNIYIDHPEYPEVQDYTYYRRQSMPEYRYFTGRTSVFAVWDDHDFGANDSWGTAAIDSPAWKPKVWQKFTDNWNNPYYGGGTEKFGVWFDFAIGDVDFFLLDGRYYRTAPGAPRPSMLGEAQKRWLFDRLKNSKATFKVVASPVPFAFGSKSGTQNTPAGPRSGALDTWEGFKEEREEVFSFIERNQIEGVVLISADRHRSDAWRIKRTLGYDFYEFESSKITNFHTHPILPESLFGYNERCSFGLLKFDTTKDDPEVTYQIVNIDNQVIHELTLKRSQLRL